MYFFVTYIPNIYSGKMPIIRAPLDQNVMLNEPVEIEASDLNVLLSWSTIYGTIYMGTLEGVGFLIQIRKIT